MENFDLVSCLVGGFLTLSAVVGVALLTMGLMRNEDESE